MATGFTRTQVDRCEAPGCLAASGVTYYVKEKKSICAECAAKSGCVRKARKDELGLFCEKHDKLVRLHCKHHDLAVCQLCGMINHKDEPCKLQDVEDAIAIKKSHLGNLQKTSTDNISSWKEFGEQLGRCIIEAEETLQSVNEHVNSVIDAEIARISKKKDNKILEINRDTDAYIEKIESRRRELLADVTVIFDKTKMKIESLQRDAGKVMQDIHKAARKIEILLEDDKKLLEGAQKLVTSVTDTLAKTADGGVVEHIKRTVKGARFIEGVGNEKYNGRIGGLEGNWEHSSTVEIPGDIKVPRIVGCMSNDEIITLDTCERLGHAYCFNIKNKTFRKVVTSDGESSCITSCALLDEDTITCGKYNRGFPTGCISLYDKNWQFIRDITLPRNATGGYAWVHADVYRDGKILAAEYDQRYIDVINPTDGSIVNTITCKEKIAVLRGVLSTRDIIAHPCPVSKKLLIIDMQGAQRDITHSEVIRDCCIDPLTDDLYVMYMDEGRKMAGIYQVFGEGYQKKVEVGRFSVSADLAQYVCNIRPVMTPSGKIIVSDGRKCHVYTKNVSL